ncbi:hypothetical protein FQN60_008480 [Etheostoma spectabile]|uniref:Choline/carnitine acyltransferase domain-containing protein n=1 Tax=Etheostoma spectabile TaxID=54343 RepID=A0A5J5CWP0_9PERO|nr:hypothetical protein FQN60_008480 [Etheostoma spectabile]
MWGIFSRTMVGMAKPCGLMKPCHLVKPVSAARVSGRYLTHQKGLPTLPVPHLQQTCERYVRALEPILKVDELKQTRELVDEFQKPGGIGERLQRSLEKRAQNTENWILLSLCRFAAKLTAGVLDFKTMIDNETLPVEYLGGKSLCMNQYYEVLSSCRIPGLKRDLVVNHAKSSKHITVVHNFQFFALEVYNSDGTPLTADQLFIQLEKICSASLQTNAEPVGILTTQHRDAWGKAYINLSMDETNRESVSAIQRSIFTLCLDGAMPQVSDEMLRSCAAVQMLHGGGSQWNSGNRWFDKTLQFIIGEDGICGANYEHAPAEGPPIVALIDHAVEYTRKPEMVQTPVVPLPVPQKLHFNITPEIKKDIEEAKHAMNMMYQRCCSTYESASLRMFRLGRTDTIRSASSASAAFVRAFDDPSKQVPSKTDCVMCFGPVVSDGYGVCYNPMNDHINFAVSSFNSCKETDAAHLAQAVEGALLDMRTLLEQTPKAKL